MSEPNKKPTQLELERWLLGELSEAERARVEGALSAEEQATLRADDHALRAELLHKRPAALFAEQVRKRSVSSGARTWLAMPVLAAAGALVLVLRSSPDSLPVAQPDASAPTERIKGLTPQLHVYRRGPAEVEELHDDATARPRDLLQLGYVGAGRRYGVLISIDGNGAVTTHLPRSGDDAAALTARGEQLLPSAYELDAAPRYERFFFVTANTPFPVERVIEAARKLPRALADSAALPLSNDFAQQSLRLRKEPP